MEFFFTNNNDCIMGFDVIKIKIRLILIKRVILKKKILILLYETL